MDYLADQIAELQKNLQRFQDQQQARSVVRQAANQIREEMRWWEVNAAKARGNMPAGSADPKDWAAMVRSVLGGTAEQLRAMGFQQVANHLETDGGAFDPQSQDDAYGGARQLARTLETYASSGELDPLT
jgi:hypothetical protein